MKLGKLTNSLDKANCNLVSIFSKHNNCHLQSYIPFTLGKVKNGYCFFFFWVKMIVASTFYVDLDVNVSYCDYPILCNVLTYELSGGDKCS